MLSTETVRELLAPFELNLLDDQIEKLLQYLDLLLRWNRKINLTSICTPEECIIRHFGESFLVSKVVPLKGRLLDVGSGAGFPGLAIKLLAPGLKAVLLEPTGKKRAFLREVVRTCRMRFVDVMEDRLEDFSRERTSGSYDIITMRAVGCLGSLIPPAASLLRLRGWLCLWVGSDQVRVIRQAELGLEWLDPLPIPHSHRREILIARRAPDFPSLRSE